MKLARLFLVCMIAGGGFAMGGSILGARFGKTALMVGGVVGGVIGAIAGAWIAGRRGWIPPGAWTRAAVGAAIGFLLAAYIAARTLSSPVGPILSTTLIGFGAILGARASRSQ